MASYNELNALIDAYINRNGVQAITGQILNGVLKAMVEQLGRGYTIMGAAIPTTAPGTPDGPECYFASETGTYTDFDGLQVAPGELALLCYTPSDGWTKETIYEGFRQVGATIDGNVGTPSVGVSYADGVLSFDFHNMKGNPGQNGQDGAAAGFGSIGADITGGVGTPGVTVESSGPATAKNLQFHFTNLKGETGVTSVVATVDNTVGTPACTVSLVGQQLTLAFSGLKGAQGDTGSSVDYPFTIVNNLTTDDATQALSAAQGVVLEGEITQLEAKPIMLVETGPSKNLFNKHLGVNQDFLGTSTAISAKRTPYTSGTYCNTEPIPVEGGKKVVLSHTTNLTNAYNIEYAADGTILSYISGAAANKSFTLNANTKYLRLTLKYADVQTFQLEYGSTSTAYEDYTPVIDKKNIAESTRKVMDDSLINYPVGRNLYNKANVRQGAIASASTPMSDGTPYTSGTYASTNLIPVIGGEYITINKPALLTNGYTIVYDKNGNILLSVTTILENQYLKLPKDAAFLRTTIKYADNDSLQIEYGREIHAYQNYIGGNFVDAQKLQETTPRILARQEFFPYVIVHPKTIYNMVNKDNLIYYNQLFGGQYEKYLVRTVGQYRVYDRFLHCKPTSAGSGETRLSLFDQHNELKDLVLFTHKNIAPQSSAKNVKILTVGDSMTDLSWYQFHLSNLLNDDNITTSFIGSMGGARTHDNETMDVFYEAQSGGNLGFITESYGQGYIVDVQGLSVYPQVSNGAPTYKDANNVTWTVRGAKLTNGANGWSGKLKVAIYGSETTAIPASGTLTKVGGGTGDSSVVYSNAVPVDYNPFWNRTTGEIDFSKYLSDWGFSAPDIIIMQWGYNELAATGNLYPDDEQITTAVNRTKLFIDTIHATHPNIKFIFGLETYGAEMCLYQGSGERNYAPKKDLFVVLMASLISQFDNANYPFVYLVPVYARVDAKLGFGPIITRNLSVYENGSMEVLQNGFDGVHPPYEYGMKEFALAYEPVVNDIVSAM